MKTTSEHVMFRFGEALDLSRLAKASEELTTMISRGSCRSFQDREVNPELSRLLCAAALASPTKSDLQQRDIILVRDPAVKDRLLELAGSEGWTRKTPNVAVFCGNNLRQRQLHAFRGLPFANDHFDAFFNAAVDAAVALSAFVTAAEAVGLGCCPISAVRNEAARVSDLLKLPGYVFPVAGLAFGYPLSNTPTVSMRLPLSATVHEDRYGEDNPVTVFSDYDARRQAEQPYPRQRATDTYGISDSYGWSEDKCRQYSLPERKHFGAFIRAKGFDLT